MRIALSTRWNAGRHTDGAALIDEILEMGFDAVELGYDLRIDLVPGVRQRIEEGVVKADSVHNFCPVPVGAPRGHPELYTLAHPDSRVREGAVEHISRTIRFAAEVGARVVVAHAGNVEMHSYSRDLIALLESGQQFTPKYEKLRFKLQVKREKKARKQLDWLSQGLERLMPVLEETGVQLALENLPTWEAIPTEHEMMTLLNRFGPRGLRYWHDIGHGQIRENLGLIFQERWLEKLAPMLAGMHLHDVMPPACDHVMPPRGMIDFNRYRRFGTLDIVRVIEPTPRTPREEIIEARDFLIEAWGQRDQQEDDNEEQGAGSREQGAGSGE